MNSLLLKKGSVTLTILFLLGCGKDNYSKENRDINPLQQSESDDGAPIDHQDEQVSLDCTAHNSSFELKGSFDIARFLKNHHKTLKEFNNQEIHSLWKCIKQSKKGE